MSASLPAADIERIAEKSPVFRALDTKARAELLSLGRPKSFASGTLLMQEGSAGTSLMIIVRGTVRVSLLTAGGKRFVIDDLSRGEVLGEMAMFDGGTRSADVKAVTNCDVLSLERRDVIPFLEGHPQACLKMVEILSRRLRRANEHMTDIAFVDLPTRLAKLLLRRSSEGEGGPRHRLSDSQSDLAAMIGCSRENVNRCLRDMQKRKIVSLEDGWIVILQRDELTALSEVA
jgi:CRP/FNR family cyclic AMP-dependent transcriptional regulator